MEVFLNNKPIQIQTGTVLQTLLTQVGIVEPKGIAVAINNVIIPKKNWTSQPLNNNDKITIITASQGG
jgi:sulfur carrier protein